MVTNNIKTFEACLWLIVCYYSLFVIVIAMASPELDEFLDFIGERVRMKGFDGYRAQLDNKSKKRVYVLILTFSNDVT